MIPSLGSELKESDSWVTADSACLIYHQLDRKLRDEMMRDKPGSSHSCNGNSIFVYGTTGSAAVAVGNRERARGLLERAGLGRIKFVVGRAP